MTLPWDQTPSQFFEQQYLCYALSAYGDKSRLQAGNRVIMPASALDRLASSNIEYPMVFSIQDAWSNDRISHCGVLEFSSEEGIVLMPNWMITNLGTQEGQLVTLKSTGLPKGTYMKIQPHSTKFIQGLSNPKAILEAILKDFCCITIGDTMAISYQGESYKINIVETKPSSAISLIETDCEVDFAQPLDYKEPPPQPAKTCCPKPVVNQEDETNNKSSFRVFTGSARRLDGQSSQPVSTTAAPNDAPPVTSTNTGNSGSCAGNMIFTRKKENNTEAIPPKKSQEAEPNSKLFKPFSGASRSLYQLHEDSQSRERPSNAISLIETDCEVDFAQPLDYKEPPPPQPKPVDNQDKDENKTDSSFRAFAGSARPLIREYTRSILATLAKIWSGLIELSRRILN